MPNQDIASHLEPSVVPGWNLSDAPASNVETVQRIRSPHGGSVDGRNALVKKFQNRLIMNSYYSRKKVSYQGNKMAPGLRWMKYKEGFSSQMVADIINTAKPKSVLDPFAGIGTTPLIASGMNGKSIGIEIMPVGVLVGKSISEVANGFSVRKFESESKKLLESIRKNSNRIAGDFRFPHIRITEGAFSRSAEKEISRAREYISNMSHKGHRTIFDMACMSILEDVSYTRKDGQYLRWDYRANRQLRSFTDKGPIPKFSDALERRLKEICEDANALKKQFGGGKPDLISGSCLEKLKDIPSSAIDMVITSPPYANRYDYTRTYALELAWLGLGQECLSSLRQQLLSATVENKGKASWISSVYGENRSTLDHATEIFRTQEAVHEVLDILSSRQSELGNKNVIRLIELYFSEMALVVAELGRIIRPGGCVIMVNDNVQYHGEELPVDFILSDFADKSGFDCEAIWKLQRGKGNSSQQMARFGRNELRKCVYKWVRRND